MTTNIERQFFDTFGIERIQTCKVTSTCNNHINYNDCNGCNAYKYPQITDRILLELICIEFAENPYKCRGYASNAEELKEYILNQFIHEFENDLYLDKEGVKHQVQALFEEG